MTAVADGSHEWQEHTIYHPLRGAVLVKTGKERFNVDKKELLKQNVNINRKTVAAHKRLEQELRKIGVEIKPSYNLEPPLGPSRIMLEELERKRAADIARRHGRLMRSTPG